ncbi:MAG: universal stress protein [Chitinophagaceae bacterium]
MSSAFNNILIPVDFSINTEIAVKKAIGLVDEQDAVIHLLHVIPPPALSPAISTDPYIPENALYNSNEKWRPGEKLSEWVKVISENVPGVCIKTHTITGHNIQQKIVDLSKILNPGLIIIGKHNYHSWLGFLNTVTPSKLAKISNCPVLTVKMGSLHNKIKTIVFPVQSLLPGRKIGLLLAIAKRYRARIHLVVLVNPTDGKPAPLYGAFIETYRTLKTNLNCPIEYSMVKGNNPTKAALRFAEIIKADMILVNPDTDAGIFRLSGQNETDMLNGNSKLEVLSVGP